MSHPAGPRRPGVHVRAIAGLLAAAALLQVLPGAASSLAGTGIASARIPDAYPWSRREVMTEPAPTPTPIAEAPAAPTWDGVIAPWIQANAAAVVDADSGALLYDKDAHKRLPPASITKIVTAMVALEYGNLDDVITVTIDGPKFAVETDSAIMGLQKGDRVTLRDLLYGLMLASGNDAAVEIARYIAGSEKAFVKLMNEKVAQLGLANTHFTNPHGLNDPDHYTTAYDISQLGLWAMKDERLREIVRTPSYTVKGKRSYSFNNLNGLTWYYPGADGLKTGWHEEAGMTIVGTAVRDGHRLFVTLLNDSRQLPDAAALLNWAFQHFTWPEQ